MRADRVVAIAVLVGVPTAAIADRTTAGPSLGTNAVPMLQEIATYRLSLDGSAQLVRSPSASSEPPATTSPDGRYRYELTGIGLAIVNVRTGAGRVLTNSLYAQRPYWSSTGKLAFTDRAGGLTRLVVFDPATGKRRVVASHVCGDALVDPWAPDGTTLAVAVSPPRTGCNGHGGVVVAVADATRGHMRRITTPQSAPIAWTRDGSRLLIGAQDAAGTFTSHLIDPRTGEGSVAFPSYGRLVEGIWSHDRRFFAALAFTGTRQVLVLADGSFAGPVEELGEVTRYAWAPRRQLLAIASFKDIRVLDALSGRIVATVPATTTYGLVVLSIAWNRGGRSLRIEASPALGRD
jgi:hypothetical protein